MIMHGTLSKYVIEPTAIAALPVAGIDKLFPVHRVYCVGRNYAAHAVEMGHDPNKEPPFFFQKNPDNLDTSGELLATLRSALFRVSWYSSEAGPRKPHFRLGLT